MVAPNTYPKRVLYYWAELHGQQMREGQPYAALEATISVSFIGNVVFLQVPEHHLEFQLRCPRHPGRPGPVCRAAGLKGLDREA